MWAFWILTPPCGLGDTLRLFLYFRERRLGSTAARPDLRHPDVCRSGYLRERYSVNGELQDAVLYGLLRRLASQRQQITIDGKALESREGIHIAQVTTGDYFAIMKAVGVKELKARLSEYLRAVRAGEELLVTDRGEVIAEIRPLSRPLASRESAEDVLGGLAREGELSRARLAKREWKWKPRPLGLAAGTATTLLDELRSDRG